MYHLWNDFTLSGYGILTEVAGIRQLLRQTQCTHVVLAGGPYRNCAPRLTHLEYGALPQRHSTQIIMEFRKYSMVCCMPPKMRPAKEKEGEKIKQSFGGKTAAWQTQGHWTYNVAPPWYCRTTLLQCVNWYGIVKMEKKFATLRHNPIATCTVSER